MSHMLRYPRRLFILLDKLAALGWDVISLTKPRPGRVNSGINLSEPWLGICKMGAAEMILLFQELNQ